MSVTIRPYRRGGWEVDIRLELPDGSEWRQRRRAPVSSRSAALRWAEARERHVLKHGIPQPTKEVPTLQGFWPRFLDGYARAERQKPSGIAAKETIGRVHLLPTFGDRRLDAITNEDVQQVKQQLCARAPKTVNNVLTVLSMLLKKAVEWEAIEQPPCTIKLLRVPVTAVSFHDFDEYERLVTAAAIDPDAYLIVLLGGEAGLRCGEMLALEWRDVNLARRQLCVQRSDWNGEVTIPKGGRLRYVPLTNRLAVALREHRHLRSDLVLCQHDGCAQTKKMVQGHVRRAGRRAGLTRCGVHELRHTFCSHLAMRGAPARAIQELAGHKNLTTTLRYMHLSPTAIESAIRLLEPSRPDRMFGDMLETRNSEMANSPR